MNWRFGQDGELNVLSVVNGTKTAESKRDHSRMMFIFISIDIYSPLPRKGDDINNNVAKDSKNT